jgi:hypothetical protein
VEVWLEKTPGHSCCIDYIEHHIPSAKFIHIVRDGKDVVASLRQVTRQYPDAWGGQWTIEKCVQRWRRAIDDSRPYAERRDAHFFVYYNDFVEAPVEHLKGICEFLQVDWESAMVEESATENGNSHVLPEEEWKRGALGKIRAPGYSKFQNELSSEEQAYVEEALIKLQFDSIIQYSRACRRYYTS